MKNYLQKELNRKLNDLKSKMGLYSSLQEKKNNPKKKKKINSKED